MIGKMLTVAPKENLRLGVACLATAVALCVVIVGVVLWKSRQTERGQVIRFSYELGTQRYGVVLNLAISPDGKQLAYGTFRGLYLRTLDGSTDAPIAATEQDTRQKFLLPSFPTFFFSPNGEWVGYWSQADRKLRKIAVIGGIAEDLCEVGYISGASWCSDDTIVYAEMGKGIMRISANGGTPEMLIKQEKDEMFSSPRILPDGKSVIFTLGPPPFRIAVQSLRSRERKILVKGSRAQYLTSGHIVYRSGNGLWAVPFDLNRLKAIGGPVHVISTVREFAISDSGTLVFVRRIPGPPATRRALQWVAGKMNDVADFFQTLNRWVP